MDNDFTYSFEWEEEPAIGESIYLYVKICCSCGNRIKRSFPGGGMAAMFELTIAPDMTIVCTACHEEYKIETNSPACYYYHVNFPYEAIVCSYIHLCRLLTPEYTADTCSFWNGEVCRMGKSYNNPPTPSGTVERSDRC